MFEVCIHARRIASFPYLKKCGSIRLTPQHRVEPYIASINRIDVITINDILIRGEAVSELVELGWPLRDCPRDGPLMEEFAAFPAPLHFVTHP